MKALKEGGINNALFSQADNSDVKDYTGINCAGY